ncbi:GNAT family N-acetyltransferase [Paraburkholderia aspalathi]|uniref:GNAT family N-acetyltransferase n=1 Tax=Paraburkholderia aspalathi TaxID=1324617 RepID=UPI0038B91DB8
MFFPLPIADASHAASDISYRPSGTSARTIRDFEACLAMDRDPEVVQFVAGPWDDLLEHQRFLKSRIEASFGEGLGYWSIFSKQIPERFFGWVLLIPYDAVGPEIEIGWRLNREAWGHGYATEAARPVAIYALRTLGLREIVADIHPENSASIRVASKLGMTHRGDGVHNGVPCRRYAITRDELQSACNGDRDLR